MAIYCSYIPQGPLAAFVNTFWFYEGETPPHARECRLPNGSVELVINLSENRQGITLQQPDKQLQNFSGSVVSGVYSRFFAIDTACMTSLMGVSFKPGGAFPFFSLPISELHNTHVALDTLWGAAAGELREQLLEVKTPQACFRILESALLARVSQSSVWHPAVAFALAEFQHPTRPRMISEVANQIGFSARHFIQIFREAVGLTPRQFCRVLRFQDVLRLTNRREQLSWTDLALSCGYFDQAHFIHDFRVFSGLTPTAYLAQRGEFHNHVPLLD